MQPTMNGFCFLQDQYFIDFPDKGLMGNHAQIGGKRHDRPCYFWMRDNKNQDILWLVPVSTKVQKYTEIMNKKIDRYGFCDTIVIGKVAGRDNAFLIQNMCPVTANYIRNQYVLNGQPVRITADLQQEIHAKARRTLKKYEKTKAIIFPDIDKIKAALIAQLAKVKQQGNAQANTATNQTPKKRRPVMRKKNTGKDQQHGR